MVNQVESELKNKGVKIPKKEFKALRKMLRKKEKRNNHKALYMEACFYAEIPYDIDEESLIFATKHGHQENDDDAIIIPIRLTIGVVVALVGLFVLVVPVIPPPIKANGGKMIAYGASIAAEACYSCIDERQKKKKP